MTPDTTLTTAPPNIGNEGIAFSKQPTRLTKQDSDDLKVFGDDGFTFFDLLDIINPLQHIPIISSIYRSVTGDTIDPGSKFVGGAIFGGPVGAVLASLDIVVEETTGKNIGEHASLMFSPTPDKSVNDNLSVRIPNKPQPSATLKTDLKPPSSPHFLDRNDQQMVAPVSFEGDSPYASAGMAGFPINRKGLGLHVQDNGEKFFEAPKNMRSTVSPKQIESILATTLELEAPKTKLNSQDNASKKNLNALLFDIQEEKIETDWVLEAILMGLKKYEANTNIKANGKHSSTLGVW